MIIYDNTKSAFNNDVISNQIINKIYEAMRSKGFGASPSEINSWNNSMNFMRNILDTDKIPNDCQIALEYTIPFSRKRIDFMICGYDQNNNKNILIIELKQWSNTKTSDIYDHVISFVGKAERELLHPSYQAKSYEYTMFTFLSVIQNGNIKSSSCSYLHNANKKDNLHLLDKTKYSYVDECPVYFRDDFIELQDKIAYFVNKGNGKEILYAIENSKIVPSKKLIDVVAKSISGNSEYMLIDSQKFVYENIMAKVNDKNNIFIINGNPGTGKSVVALNLLAEMLKHKKLVTFVAPNSAYRNNLVNAIKIDKTISKDQKFIFNEVCKGSGNFYNAKENIFDWLIVDEAHRLKNSSAYMYNGNNQIEDIIKVAKNVVFFVDDKQSIRYEDIGSTKNIIEIAKEFKKNIFTGSDYKLETQFRCAGAQGYINALDTILQLEETGNFYLNENSEYDIRICDTPQQMQELIEQRIQEGYTKSRIVAGFAWEWKTKNMQIDELVFNKDIVIEEYNYEIAWNYNDGKMLWATRDDGIMQAGCIHTSQGLEFDYCGVIIGNDLAIDENNIIFGNIKEYKDISGKKNLKDKPELLSQYIKNIYKILLSRGQKGTYIFIRNNELREYFKKHIK